MSSDCPHDDDITWAKKPNEGKSVEATEQVHNAAFSDLRPSARGVVSEYESTTVHPTAIFEILQLYYADHKRLILLT